MSALRCPAAGRRTCVPLLAAGVFCLLAALLGAAPHADAPRKKVLIFTKSSGFQHPIIKRYQEGLSEGEKIMAEIVTAAGMEPVCSKDGSLINARNLQDYAAVVFYTSGDLCQVAKQAPDGKADVGPVVTPEGKAEMLELIKGGKLGFVGIHSASDTWHTVDPALSGKDARYAVMGEKLDPYLRMLGAEFIAHDKHQAGTFEVVDPAFPGMAYAGTTVRREKDEWYSLKEFAPDMHVLMVMQTEGMEGPHYQRGPYPLSWIRRHGEGRVFYTGLGHGRESWDDAAFRSLIGGGIRWAAGLVDADASPNLERVAPRHAEIPAPPVKEKAPQKPAAVPAV